MSRRRGRSRALLAIVVLLLIPAAALAVTPRVSFTDMENDFMCIQCHESLAVAQSPESYSERQYLRDLIAKGLTRHQIEQAMVTAYSSAVLAKPPASGFNLTVYILPPLVVVVGAAILLITIPRWRRRTRERGPTPGAPGTRALDPADAERLEQDLARSG